MADGVADKNDRQPRSAEELQAEIEETRERLVANLDQLKAETTPTALLDKAKRAVSGVFVDHQTGELRKERVAAVAVAVVGLVVVRRGLKHRAERKQIERLSQVVWVPVPRSGVSPEWAAMARTAKELGPPASPALPTLPSAG